MSKKNQTPESEQQKEQPVKGNPIVDDLLKNDATTLTAKTREELFDKFDELKASAKDVPLMTGAVGRKDDGNFILQVNIVER